ncbi:MAG: hypothetical protein QXN29_05015, partial [Thermofilaceae archaeon]
YLSWTAFRMFKVSFRSPSRIMWAATSNSMPVQGVSICEPISYSRPVPLGSGISPETAGLGLPGYEPSIIPSHL